MHQENVAGSCKANICHIIHAIGIL